MGYNLTMYKPVKTVGYIYFILAERYDAVKIGFTRGAIADRLKHYKSATPYDYDLLKLIRGTMWEEKQLHKRFAKYQIRHEWFDYSDELKEYIELLK